MARLYLLFLVLPFFACKTGGPLLSKRTPHEQYAHKLTEAGLDATAIGRSWMAAGGRALAQPVHIQLPYREQGYLPAGEPRAMGLRFTAKRGQRLQFEILKNPVAGFLLYIELWQPAEGGGKPQLLTALDTNKTVFSFDADRDQALILRLQPELLVSGEYTLNITVGPSLGFPVAGRSPKIGSFWGDARDAGGRKHEGIDIFAPKRTPAIAAEDGVITSVREGGLGGKVVFMRPRGRDINLYYAHLDEQLVRTSQSVAKGDTIGLVGNTGNAQSTPPHLHFGIYAIGGAIDPLPFVEPTIRQAPAPSFNRSVLSGTMRLREKFVVRSADGSAATTYGENTIVEPWSVASGFVTARFPDGRLASIPQSAIGLAGEIRSMKLRGPVSLLVYPGETAPKKGLLLKEARVSVLGYFNSYTRIRSGDQEGWVLTNVLG